MYSPLCTKVQHPKTSWNISTFHSPVWNINGGRPPDISLPLPPPPSLFPKTAAEVALLSTSPSISVSINLLPPALSHFRIIPPLLARPSTPHHRPPNTIKPILIIPLILHYRKRKPGRNDGNIIPSYPISPPRKLALIPHPSPPSQRRSTYVSTPSSPSHQNSHDSNSLHYTALQPATPSNPAKSTAGT